MSSDQGVEPARVALHTITTRPLTLRKCINECVRVGFGGICPWAEHVEPVGAGAARRMIDDAGLTVPSYVRGGFFVHPEKADRAKAIDECRAMLDVAGTLGASQLVIVSGAHPAVALDAGRSMVADALVALEEHAADVNVDLSLEPLHPMYAASRSCVNTLAQAAEICNRIDHRRVGVAVDVYHVWWDWSMNLELARLSSGREHGETAAVNRLRALHVCDWLADTNNLLTDRGLMGEGCIPIRDIRLKMESLGFEGLVEVEILSERHWARPQAEFVDDIVTACREHV